MTFDVNVLLRYPLIQLLKYAVDSYLLMLSTN